MPLVTSLQCWASFALKKMLPTPVTRFIDSPKTGWVLKNSESINSNFGEPTCF
jgi:hypothetical protein